MAVSLAVLVASVVLAQVPPPPQTNVPVVDNVAGNAWWIANEPSGAEAQMEWLLNGRLMECESHLGQAFSTNPHFLVRFWSPHGLSVGANYNGGTIFDSHYLTPDVIGVDVPPPNVDDFITRTVADPLVRICDLYEYDYVLPWDPKANFPDLPNYQWHHERVFSLPVYASSKIPLCDLDAGDGIHSELSGLIAKLYHMATPPFTTNAHATQVLGAASASLNGVEGQGVYGGVLWLVNGANGTTQGYEFNMIHKGIQWCMNEIPGYLLRDRLVILIEFSSLGVNSNDAAAIATAWSAGHVIVNPIGNWESSHPGATTYPASYPFVIPVVNTDQENELYFTSSRGLDYSIAAPGAGIWIPDGSGGSLHSFAYGTSYSAPQVAGAIARAWEGDLTLSNSQIRSLLECSASDLGPQGRDPDTGYGLLNMHKFVHHVQLGGCVPVFGCTLTPSVGPVVGPIGGLKYRDIAWDIHPVAEHVIHHEAPGASSVDHIAHDTYRVWVNSSFSGTVGSFVETACGVDHSASISF